MPEKKYGLILRAPKSQQKQQLTRPQIPKPVAFNDDDDDDVELEISRQAAKNKSLKEVEEQHKKALEEDPSVFDYDGVYDDMKSKSVQPKVQDKQKREAKYIGLLKQKAELREREHEIVYERKLAKERSKDDHLYGDKDKFVTSAYKKKLEEKRKWEMEQRMRELLEERDDVTKKSDLTDFYYNLAKNVAFGAGDKPEVKKQERQEEEPAATSGEELKKRVRLEEEQAAAATLEREGPSTSPTVALPPTTEDIHQREASTTTTRRSPEPGPKPVPNPSTSGKENPPSGEGPPSDEPKRDHHKKTEDALAAAKARFLARKRAKVE